jgi:hypothetical protein
MIRLPRAFDYSQPEGEATEQLQVAGAIYELHGARKNLAIYYPPGKHAFPPVARRQAYEFLDRHLKK